MSSYQVYAYTRDMFVEAPQGDGAGLGLTLDGPVILTLRADAVPMEIAIEAEGALGVRVGQHWRARGTPGVSLQCERRARGESWVGHRLDLVCNLRGVEDADPFPLTVTAFRFNKVRDDAALFDGLLSFGLLDAGARYAFALPPTVRAEPGRLRTGQGTVSGGAARKILARRRGPRSARRPARGAVAVAPVHADTPGRCSAGLFVSLRARG